MKQSHLNEQLKHIGLTDKEALIYGSLLELGGSGFPSSIAEKAGIKRSTAYKILLGLSIKGLVNEIQKRNKIFYQVEKPERLIRHAKSQIQIAEDNLEKAERLFPELQGLYALTAGKPKVRFFEGTEEVNSIYLEMVTPDQKPYEMIAFANAKAFKNNMTFEQVRYFVKEKEKLDIPVRAIVPDTAEDRQFNPTVFDGIHKKYWPKLRYIPADMFPFETEITLYSTDKVAIAKFGNKHPIAVIIEDAVIYGTIKLMFELAWLGAERFDNSHSDSPTSIDHIYKNH
ncbi:MAG: helix-turn-helix domain-containing protein [Candidatus Pacebacteria bacterium]|nr:helix-turn-helix domain-containing protein [Candidatus Paceibacterota bacterium]